MRYVTPLLAIDPEGISTADLAVQDIESGDLAVVDSDTTAIRVLIGLGLSKQEALGRIQLSKGGGPYS